MRHNDNCLEILSALSFPSQSIQKAVEADSPQSVSRCESADFLTVAQPVSCHKHLRKLPVGRG